jgi:hypothetical protein
MRRQGWFIPPLFSAGEYSVALLKIITAMKWIILLAAGFTMSAPGAAAQQPDTAQVLVHYKFSHIRDTINRAKPYTEKMVLLMGKKAGVYRTNEEHKSAVEYYQFPNEKKMVSYEWVLISRFLVTEAFPAVNWQITGDTASFGGLHCQKATAHFKGRDYTAWFCPDLLLHVGPWKLNGLPGVILEAFDAKKEVCFTFDGVEKVGGASIIRVPENVSKITPQEFAKLQETARKDPEAFLRLIIGPPNGVTAGGNGPVNGPKIDMKPGSQPVINNPIELPEKK